MRMTRRSNDDFQCCLQFQPATGTEETGGCNRNRSELVSVMAMQDVPQMRKTFVLNRGRYDAYEEEAMPGAPE